MLLYIFTSDLHLFKVIRVAITFQNDAIRYNWTESLSIRGSYHFTGSPSACVLGPHLRDETIPFRSLYYLYSFHVLASFLSFPLFSFVGRKSIRHLVHKWYMYRICQTESLFCMYAAWFPVRARELLRFIITLRKLYTFTYIQYYT